jgi:hypothetical protein
MIQKHRISTVIYPFLLDDNDPYKHQDIKKSIKVLTKKTKRSILKGTNKLYRKDNNMAQKTQATNKPIVQWGALAILAVTSVVGMTELLGGTVHDAVGATIIGFLLLIQFLDVKF